MRRGVQVGAVFPGWARSGWRGGAGLPCGSDLRPASGRDFGTSILDFSTSILDLCTSLLDLRTGMLDLRAVCTSISDLRAVLYQGGD